MSKETIKAQIKQNKTDQQIAQDAVQKLVDEEARLQGELTEADRPKIELGDEITRNDRTSHKGIGCTRIALYDGNGYLSAFDFNGNLQMNLEGHAWCYDKTGRNIFADMKRNSVDLKEFTVCNNDVEAWKFHAKAKECNIVEINCKKVQFTPKEAIEIHQKLGQMIDTFQREQAKNG